MLCFHTNGPTLILRKELEIQCLCTPLIFLCILSVPHTALYCSFWMKIYVANATGALSDPFKSHCFWKGQGLPVASTSDCWEHLWPQNMPGLHMVLDGNATELTPRSSLWPMIERQWLKSTPAYFPLGDTTQWPTLGHFLETPKWDRVPVAYCCDVLINVSSNSFPFLPCFPSPLPYQCFLG